MKSWPNNSKPWVVVVCLIIYLGLIQLSLPILAPAQVIYNQRLNYNLVKDRTTNMEAVLEQVKLIIDRENLQEYAVILGDSVAYSNPGPAAHSIASVLNHIYQREERGFPVFNLAMPAMQMGDVYTMLLAMEQYGISSDRLLFNVNYSGFIRRDQEHPAVYWLSWLLKRLDPETYQSIESILPPFARVEKIRITQFSTIKNLINTFIYSEINLFKYKDAYQYYLKSRITEIRGIQQEPPQPVQPWHTKDFLLSLMQQPEYLRDYDDTPFVMDESNPEIFFLNRIMELQQDKHTIVFFTAVNDQLLPEQVSQPGYQENLARIHGFFAEKDLIYLDTQGRIDNNLYSDHIHLTSEGYYQLSMLLLEEMSWWD